VADEDWFAAPFYDDLFFGVRIIRGQGEDGCGWREEKGRGFEKRGFWRGSGDMEGMRGGRTFLPSGIAARSISTLAWASTSAEADMLTRKSVSKARISHHFPPRIRNQIISTTPANLLSRQFSSPIPPLSPQSPFQGQLNSPCTVAFAPAAASNPILPAIKY